MTLARNFLPVTEGDDGDRTSVSVCLVLVGVHDGLQRVLFFNLSTVVLGTICTFLFNHSNFGQYIHVLSLRLICTFMR